MAGSRSASPAETARWSVTAGSGGSGFIGTYSDIETPPSTALYAMDGGRIAWLEENPLNEDHPYAPYLARHVYPEYGTLTAADGQTDLHWQMYRPDHCTAATPCPAIVQVYGGPGVQTVTGGWQSLRDQILVQSGYVLFKVDNRGSSNRGHAFEGALHRRMGILEVERPAGRLDWLQARDFRGWRACRPVGLVLWWLHDADDHAAGTGPVCRRYRRSTGHRLVAL